MADVVVRKCKQCRKEIPATARPSQLYCCSKCRSEFHHNKNKYKRENSNHENIASINAEARKNNMSYGQYVAMTHN